MLITTFTSPDAVDCVATCEQHNKHGDASVRRVAALVVEFAPYIVYCIHAAIVATTIAATVASCIHYRRPVGATIASTVAATIAQCIRPIKAI